MTNFDSLGQLLAHHQQLVTLMTKEHDGMTDKQLRRCLLVEYRCARRNCLLLRIFNSSNGPAVHRPSYTLTQERNMHRSSASGREHNTSDGFNHWRSSTGPWIPADNLGSDASWSLHCRHVDVSIRWADVDQDVTSASNAGSPLRRGIRAVSSADSGLVPLRYVTQD